MLTSAELFERIPEEWRDLPMQDLQGLTPRQVVEAGHADYVEGHPGCPMCRSTLKGLAGVAGR